MVLLIFATAFLSAWLDNVTTVMLMAPVTIAACTKLGVPVVPYLMAEVMACNIGGAATLIGDPPNIMIGSRAGLSFNDFLLHMAPITTVLIVVFAVMARWLFCGAFSYDPRRAAHVMAMRERDAITDTRLLAVSGIVVTIVMVCFVLHTTLHLEPSVVAVSGGLILLAASRMGARKVAADVEWETLAFFAGLFVMVGALVQTGILTDLGQAAARALDGNLFGASMALLFGSIVPSAVIDNIPFVASTSPIVSEIVTASGGAEQARVLWWSFALGADLAGNATIIASSANVVTVGIADRAGHHISFWQFSRHGLIVTAVTTVLAGFYVWLRYFAFA